MKVYGELQSFQVGGMEIIPDVYRAKIYKNGKKDGNKLGKRKRNLTKMIANGFIKEGKSIHVEGKIIMHINDYKKLKASPELMSFTMGYSHE